MQDRRRKTLLLVVKLLVAGGLLAWVLSQASWNDYLLTSDGRSFAVVSAQPDWQAPASIQVRSGMLWWKHSQTLDVAQIAPVKDPQGRPLEDLRSRYCRPGVASSVANLNYWMLAAAMGAFLLSYLVVAIRWRFLLRIVDVPISVGQAIRLTFIGLFYNVIVPGTVGGDVVKAYYVSKHTHRTAAVLVSIFVDRLLGMTELVLLAGVMLTLVLTAGWESFDRLRHPAMTVMVVVGIVVAGLTFVLSERLRRILHLQKLYGRLPIAHHIAAAGEAAKLYRRRLPRLLQAIGITFGAHVAFVGAVALIGVSLSLPVPWYSYFLYIPLIYIIGAVPVAPGGVGLIEQLFIMFFAAVNPSSVLAMALLARLTPMIWTLPGMYFAMVGPRLPKADAMEAELEAEAVAGAPVPPQTPPAAGS